MEGCAGHVAMTAFFLSVFGYGKIIVQAVVQWLSRRSLAEMLAIALGLALAVDHLALLMAHRHSAKLQSQIISLSAELNKLSTAKNDQKVVTQEKIRVVTKLVHDADGKAKVVENAPPAPDCKTKPEVLQADL